MEKLVDRTIAGEHVAEGIQDPLPARARVVIVGGGIIGTSIAHHLALEGERDVLLLDRNTLGSGTSWHAAGLVTGARGNSAMTKLAKYSLETYAQLGEHSGVDVRFERCGMIAAARTPGRLDEITYSRDVASANGLSTEMLSSERYKELWPLANPEGILGSLYLPDDGTINPGYGALAFAKLAAKSGVSIRENVQVTDVVTDRERVSGVETDKGRVEAEVVVLACGLWTRDLARRAGAHVGLYGAEHVHVRSNPIEGAHPQLPYLRDMDNSYYIRHECGRLLVGAFEPKGIPRRTEDISADGFAEFPPNWEHFGPVRSQAESSVPALVEAGYDRFLNAPESFTPDSHFALGETAETDGLFVAAGMNSQGIIFAPGVGRELASWIVSGSPQFDAHSVDVRRFSPTQSNRRFLHDRTQEGLGGLYKMHWPHLQMETGRNVRRTPLHQRLKDLGAAYGESNNWERPNWYGKPGTTPKWEYSYRRPGWFDNVAAEHQAVREAVGVFDLSPFAKIEVAGPDALDVVQRAFTAQMDVEVNRSVYTLSLNAAGGIELDLTVTRLAEDRFLAVAPSAEQTKTKSILQRLVRGTAAVVTDLTSAMAVINVAGPKSRDLLAKISPEDWSNEVHPFGYGREVEIADGYAYALRVSFTGELGYELYVPAELAVNVFDAVWEAGQEFGIKPAGYFALDTLRLEKGFRHLGHDLGPIYDPYTAGLKFTLAMNKTPTFTGKSALAGKESPEYRTRYFTIEDPEVTLVHDEAVFHNGVPVGRATSGGHGHTLGKPVGLAHVQADIDVNSGEFTVQCRGQQYPATFSTRPFYDPKSERMRS